MKYTTCLLKRYGKVLLAGLAVAVGAAVMLGSTCSVLNKAPTVPVVSGPSAGVVGVPVTFKATATDPESDSIAFQFDWGDTSGLVWTILLATGETTSVQHTYSDSGTFSVKVKAKDRKDKTSGFSADAKFRVLGVRYPDSVVSRIPVATGRLNLIPPVGGKYLLVVGTRDYVAVVDLDQQAVAHEVSVGPRPWGLAAVPTRSMVYVTSRDGNCVLVIDMTSWEVIDTVPVGSYPKGLAATRDGTKLLVCCRGSNRVYVIRTADNLVSDSIWLPSGPTEVQIDSSGTNAYVLRSTGVASIRLSDNVVTDSIALDLAQCLVASGDGSRLFLGRSDSTVAIVRTDDLSVEAIVSLPEQPLNVAWVPGGYIAIPGMHSVYYVDCAGLSVAGAISFGAVDVERAVGSSPDGRYLYVGAAPDIYVVRSRP
jgi:YVTN family beta-propeller protein